MGRRPRMNCMNVAAQRGGHPADRHFTVLRISGSGDLWVSECVISYDGVPFHSVSIMEFCGALVPRETQYFADPSTRPSGGQRWQSRCQTVQADADDRESAVSAPKDPPRTDPGSGAVVEQRDTAGFVPKAAPWLLRLAGLAHAGRVCQHDFAG